MRDYGYTPTRREQPTRFPSLFVCIVFALVTLALIFGPEHRQSIAAPQSCFTKGC